LETQSFNTKNGGKTHPESSKSIKNNINNNKESILQGMRATTTRRGPK